MKDTWKRLFEEASGGAEGGGGAAAPDPAVQMAALQAQIDALTKDSETAKTQAREHEENARYWHDQAKGKTAAEPKPPAAAAEPGDEVDPIEAQSKGGMKALDELLIKRGFVKKADVDTTVEARAVQFTVEAKLAKDFPEITDQASQFFKDTAVEYAALTKQGVPHIVAIQQAARNVRYAAIEAGTYETAKAKADREERAAAASGDRNKKGGSSKGEEESDELDNFQKTIVAQMCPDDMKLEDFEKAYKARAKAGINYTVR